VAGKNEIGDLAYTFNHMSRELASYDGENRRLIAALARGTSTPSAASRAPSTRRTRTPGATPSGWRRSRSTSGRSSGSTRTRSAPSSTRASSTTSARSGSRTRSSRSRARSARRRWRSCAPTRSSGGDRGGRRVPRGGAARGAEPPRALGRPRLPGPARRRGDPAPRADRERRGHVGRLHVNRPYQAAIAPGDVLPILAGLRGTQLEPRVHDALVAVLRRRGVVGAGRRPSGRGRGGVEVGRRPHRAIPFLASLRRSPKLPS